MSTEEKIYAERTVTITPHSARRRVIWYGGLGPTLRS